MNIFNRLFEGEGRTLAEAEIVGQGDRAYCNLKSPNQANLIILLSAYFTKIRWYMETEPLLHLQRMKQLYDQALEDLPVVKEHIISSCAENGGTMVFTARAVLHRGDSIGLINEMPNALGDRDSPDSCFVLLRAVWERLDDEWRPRLAETLQQLRPVIMAEEMDRSGRGLEKAYVTSCVVAGLLTQGSWEYL